MTDHAALRVEVDEQTRWREWQARGTAADLRRSARMRVVVVVAVAALTGYFLFIGLA